MAEWFECKVKYERTMQDGSLKKVIEVYLVDALNFTEAERRIIEELKTVIRGDFQVTDIKRARYAEIFKTLDDAADRWFKAKLAFIILDEKTGKERGYRRLCHCFGGRNLYCRYLPLQSRHTRKARISALWPFVGRHVCLEKNCLCTSQYS